MSIGFHLELGYQSGFLSHLHQDEQWEFMRELADNINQVYGLEVSELAKSYGFPKSIQDEYYAVGNFAIQYLKTGGMNIKEDEQTIAIYASGGDEYRTAKEAVALAVCHVIMMECAKKGFHVNLMTV
jgi:hypothetical protein